MFYSYSASAHGMPEIRESWGEDFPKYMSAILRGFVFALGSFEEQLAVVCSREGFGAHIGFYFYISPKATEVVCVAKPNQWNDFFELRPGFPHLEFPFQLMGKEELMKKEQIVHWDEGNVSNAAGFAAKRFAADFARDGIPKEMKRNINLLAQTERLRSHVAGAVGWKEVDDWQAVQA